MLRRRGHGLPAGADLTAGTASLASRGALGPGASLPGHPVACVCVCVCVEGRGGGTYWLQLIPFPGNHGNVSLHLPSRHSDGGAILGHHGDGVQIVGRQALWMANS